MSVVPKNEPQQILIHFPIPPGTSGTEAVTVKVSISDIKEKLANVVKAKGNKLFLQLNNAEAERQFPVSESETTC
jgi:hypothetical protein